MDTIKKLKVISEDISILFVEDNGEIREVFHQYLKKFFKIINVCENGLDGLEEYKKNSYDVVITDINMPKMNGLIMSRKIKEINEEQHIIIISAYKDIENYVEAIKIGIDGYILKPIEYEQLNQILYKTVTQINTQVLNEKYKNGLEKLVEEKTEEIKQQYITDSLTKVKNRIALDKRLEQKGFKTLILLDINNFNMISNNYGFAFSDKVLIEIAQILKKYESKEFELFRLESDIFAFFSTENKLELAKELANKIKYDFNESYLDIDNVKVYISFSIAIDSAQNRDLLKTTSIVMQEIKEIDKKLIKTYEENSEFERNQLNNLSMIDKIREFLKQNKLEIYFQPIKDITSDKIHKYEVLSRFKTQDGQIIQPNDFLKPLELSGLMTEFTRKVIDKAFDYVKDKDVEISINITLQDLKENYLIDYLEEKVKEYNLQKDKIILEILESISLDNEPFILDELKKLKDLGFKLAIDDFGSENSNFSRLIQINVDYIKIDGSFIKNIVTDKNSQEIVKSILVFAHNIGQKVIAEYVYNQEVYEFLKDLNIDYAQGYYISKPKKELE